MPDTVIIQTENEPENEPESTEVIAQVVEDQHDDAFTLGMLAAKVAEHDAAIVALNGRVEAVESNTEWAQRTANDAVDIAIDAASIASDVAEEVEESLEEVQQEIEEESEPEPPEIEEDTPPGKTHWFRRPAKEWIGR